MICLILGFFLAIQCYSQEKQVNRKLEEILDNVRDRKNASIDESVLYKTQNHNYVLSRVETWITDSLTEVRIKALKILNNVATVSDNQSVRQKTVSLFLSVYGDQNSKVVNLSGDCLINYRYPDYDEASKNLVKKYVSQKSFGYANWLKIAGFLNLNDLTSVIKEKIYAGTLSQKDKFAAYLALARMGDGEATDYCLNSIKAAGINSSVVYDLLPDLVYTRQHKCFDYLIEILENNEPLCESANPNTSGRILCGYRIMEFLAPVIEKFPLQTSSSGDLLSGDYKQALKLVREWFKANPGYTIKTDRLR